MQEHADDVMPKIEAEDQAAPWQIVTIASLFVVKDSSHDDYEEGYYPEAYEMSKDQLLCRHFRVNNCWIFKVV